MKNVIIQLVIAPDACRTNLYDTAAGHMLVIMGMCNEYSTRGTEGKQVDDLVVDRYDAIR